MSTIRGYFERKHLRKFEHEELSSCSIFCILIASTQEREILVTALLVICPFKLSSIIIFFEYWVKWLGSVMVVEF